MTDDRLWPLYADHELGDLPEPAWLVDEHLTDGFAVMYGPPKVGKTFLAVDWALSIAAGTPWLGRKVEQAPVVYISGEGAGGLHRRIRAWKTHRNVWDTKLYVIPAGVRLGNHEHVVKLRADLHATQARLLVVDTLARSMAGLDENSSHDMGLVVQALDWLRGETSCAVLVVHHSGKDSTRGARGSTSLFGAVDTSIRVFGEKGKLTVRCEGQKDAPPFAPLSLELAHSARSCVLVESRGGGRFAV